MKEALQDRRMDQTLEPENRSADARRHPRFKIEVDIKILSRTCGALKGRTVDISEYGISAMLTIEAPLGEVVELSFTLPGGPVTLCATVRQKNAFRYGFEFVHAICRFRNTYLRNKTHCPEGLRNNWMGHAENSMDDLYDKI
jgi:hypothetical protein